MNKKIYFKLIFIFLFFLSLIFIIQSFITNKISPICSNDPITRITSVMLEEPFNEPREINLPTKLTINSPRTPISISTKITPNPRDSLLVKTVFSPMEIYINGKLVHKAGEEGTYPSFMNDPPTLLTLLLLPYDEGELDIKINYLSLTQKSTLSLPVILMGSESAILSSQVATNGFSLLFSLILIFIGFVMLIIFLTIASKLESGKVFLWLSLFSLSAGIWIFGECDLSAFLVPYPSLLYSMAYLGLFTIAIPFLHFGLIILEPNNKIPFYIMLVILSFSLSISVIFQLLGIMDFTKSLYWFHIVTPLGFIIFALSLIVENFKYDNPAAKRFAPAIILLTFSTILELLNYWLNITNILTMFFQLGVLCFIISLGIASGFYIKETLFTAAEKKRLKYEMSAMGQRLELQRKQYKKIAENEASINAKSHDLRHQLRILREFNNEKKHIELGKYIDTLIDSIPSNKDMKICENYPINAIATYYLSIAQKHEINISLNLAIPSELDNNLESDLSIVIGNLLENAVEACKLVDKEKRFIRLNSNIKYDTLAIVVDNSFNGIFKKSEGGFLSSKRKGEGIGLSSIMAVAKKHHGSAKFEPKGTVFQSSIYMRIGLLSYASE